MMPVEWPSCGDCGTSSIAIWPKLTAEWEAKIGSGPEMDRRKLGTMMREMYEWISEAVKSRYERRQPTKGETP